ncbi:biopolymer transporter ExbD [bacterium]|nr:biopolymer transporter ExbD [bacterium]
MNNSAKGIHNINMTPLIDVSLVLVVLLLLLTPLAFESGIGIEKNSEGEKLNKKVTDRKIIELEIVSDDSVIVDNRFVSRMALVSLLRPLISKTGDCGVVISCRGDVSHGAFVDVLDKSRRSGVSGISVMEK